MTVDEIRSTSGLALAQVLYCSKHIRLNCFSVLNLFFYDSCLRECILDPLVVDSLLNTIEEALLSKTETVRLRASLD